MPNRDLDAAWTYHNATRHSNWSVRHDQHYLDWPNQPMPFKIYPTLPPLPLPREFPPTAMPALSAIAQFAVNPNPLLRVRDLLVPELPSDVRPTAAVLPDLPRLAALLYFSAGVTKRRAHAGKEFFFRAAACTGALYEIELYLVCADLPDLPAGVYHFGPGDFALRLLRSGDHRGALVRATGAEPSISHAPLTLVCTGTYWRNAWKYQARTYRHFGWDNGTILANLLAMCAALALPARVVLGFEDAVVNRLLGLDTQREVAFSLVALGHLPSVPPVGAHPSVRPAFPPQPPEPVAQTILPALRDEGSVPDQLPQAAPQDIPSLALETLPLSKTEVDYPAMRAMHAASELHSGREAADWRAALPAKNSAVGAHPSVRPAFTAPTTESLSPRTSMPESSLPQISGAGIPLAPLADDQLPPDSVGEVILRRGSSREFVRSSITFAQLSTLLDRATRGIPADFPPLNDLYLIAHAVDGLPPGAYFFHRDANFPVGAHQGVRPGFAAQTLECLKQGEFRDEAGYLGLEQDLPADASVAIFFLADLQRILERFGNRGYRAVQLEAGILGGKLYLAAYAQRLGATGLTFYDDDVVKFFSPHAAGKSAIFLTAIGKSRKLHSIAKS